MLAVAKTGPEPGLKAIEKPEPRVTGPRDVLVEVAACGICGTDLSIYRSDEHVLPVISRHEGPLVVGHEISGTVREVGHGVTEFKPGDRVACDAGAACGFCFFCSRGLSNLCCSESRRMLGINMDGGYAKYVRASPAQLYRLPDSVSFVEAAVLEPLGVVVRAMERSHVKPGDTVAVIGPGPLGILGAMLLVRGGVHNLIVAGLKADRDRLRVAREIGATTVEIEGDNLKEAAGKTTGGLGVDAVFDFAGGPDAMVKAVGAVRRGGEIILVGSGELPAFHGNPIMVNELTVIGSYSKVQTSFRRAINIVADKVIDLNKVITHVVPLAEYEKAFQLLLSRKTLKAVLEP